MNSLYALTCLPSSLIRKIWYYIGVGVQAAALIKRQIMYWARRERNDRWMETKSLWSIGMRDMHWLFTLNNPNRIPIILWCEYRIMVANAINNEYVKTIEGMRRLLGMAFRSSYKTIFEREFIVKY